MFVLSPTTATGQLAAGNFSAGPNGLLNSNGSRMDIELAAVWQLQNGGVGNVGLIRQRRAERDLASVEFTRTVYRVRSEVAQALARLQTARLRVVETEEGVRQSVESADKNFIGLRETTRPAGELLRLIVRPQEVVAGDRRDGDGLRAIRRSPSASTTPRSSTSTAHSASRRSGSPRSSSGTPRRRRSRPGPPAGATAPIATAPSR